MTNYTIERKSPLTAEDQHHGRSPWNPSDYLAWENGMMIQHALPYLTVDEREFIKTGMIDDEWDQMCNGSTRANAR